MDAPGPLDPRHVPVHLDARRAAAWCVRRTLLDLQRSVARHRTISLPNLTRLFDRRRCRLARQRPALAGRLRADLTLARRQLHEAHRRMSLPRGRA